MPNVLTDRGKVLFAARDLPGGADVRINNIRVGQGVSYDATAAATGMRDPNPIRYDLPDTAFEAAESTVAVNFIFEGDITITATEVGYFSDDDLIYLNATAGFVLFVKAQETNAAATLFYRYTDGEPMGMTFMYTVSIPPKASVDEVQAGTDDLKYVTALALQGLLGSTNPNFIAEVKTIVDGDYITNIISGDYVKNIVNDTYIRGIVNAPYIQAIINKGYIYNRIKEMLSGNTETLISVNPQDGDQTIDFVVDPKVRLFRFGTSATIPSDLAIGETYVQRRKL